MRTKQNAFVRVHVDGTRFVAWKPPLVQCSPRRDNKETESDMHGRHRACSPQRAPTMRKALVSTTPLAPMTPSRRSWMTEDDSRQDPCVCNSAEADCSDAAGGAPGAHPQAARQNRSSVGTAAWTGAKRCGTNKTKSDLDSAAAASHAATHRESADKLGVFARSAAERWRLHCLADARSGSPTRLRLPTSVHM